MVLDTRLRYNPISSALVQSAATCIVADVCALSILSRSSSPGTSVGIAGNAMINNGGRMTVYCTLAALTLHSWPAAEGCNKNY